MNMYGPLKRFRENVYTANGQKSRIIGTMKCKIQFSNFEGVRDILIATDLIRPCVIGMDLLMECPLIQPTLTVLRRLSNVNLDETLLNTNILEARDENSKPNFQTSDSRFDCVSSSVSVECGIQTDNETFVTDKRDESYFTDNRVDVEIQTDLDERISESKLSDRSVGIDEMDCKSIKSVRVSSFSMKGDESDVNQVALMSSKLGLEPATYEEDVVNDEGVSSSLGNQGLAIDEQHDEKKNDLEVVANVESNEVVMGMPACDHGKNEDEYKSYTNDIMTTFRRNVSKLNIGSVCEFIKTILKIVAISSLRELTVTNAAKSDLCYAPFSNH